MNMSPNRKPLIIVVVGLLLMFALIGLYGGKRGVNPDTAPEDPSISEYSKYANIEDPTKLLVEKLGGIVQYDMLSSDLRYFGSVNYDKYRKNTSTIVGFLIKGDITKKDSVVELNGVYGASSNKIKVTVQLLANKRLKTSITDTATGANVDSQLNSNSQFNDFISKLPVSNNGYTIEYSSPKNKVVVRLNDRNPDLYEQAINYIKSLIKDGSYDAKMITSIFPPNSFGQ